MDTGWHITAPDIVCWVDANPRRAQELLPLLIQKLIIASINFSSLHFPSGDSISKRGWDGILISQEENLFVPLGQSFWELSTEKSPKKKAEGDYKKRTKDSKILGKDDIVFVSFTVRSWSKKNQWENEKRSLQQWKDVKCFDVDDLKTWIELCPAVHRWFASVIGKLPSNVMDIDQAWDSWSHSTNPPVSKDLVIAGRLNASEEIVKKLKASPQIMRVRSGSQEEAYAFTLAVIKNYIEFQSRCLIVTNQNAWDLVAYSQTPLILLPQFNNPTNVGIATQNGHYVILPKSRIECQEPDTVEVGLPVKEKLVEALVVMGINKEDAEGVVKSCRGFLNPMRRHPKLNPQERHLPIWEKPENACLILPVLVAGGWMADNLSDCAEMATLSGLAYGEFEEKLYRLMSLCDDPPVRRVGNTWQIFSRDDAWFLLSRYINPSFLNRFCDTAKNVLTELDPRFEMSPNDRWMANIRGKKTKYSQMFRHGLVESMAMLGGYGDKDCVLMDGFSIQDKISVLIHDLLINDMSGQRWWSLSSELPLLAEAAPDIFLDAVEEGIKNECSLMELFVEEGTFGGCSHSGLLWALEGVSWNQKFLSRVTLILAKLARLDPGGRYSNRPMNSLREIFLGWRPHTKANLNERIKILTNLTRMEPEIGWKLLLNLFPERGGGISTNIHQPYFRCWAEGWDPVIIRKDYFDHTVAVCKLCLQLVEQAPDVRWPELIDEMPYLPKECFDDALNLFDQKRGSDFCESVSDEICNKLRDIVSRHRRCAKTDWALQKEAIERLEEVLERFLPKDIVVKYKFLFDKYSIDLVDMEEDFNLKQTDEFVERRRIEALENIWNMEGVEGIKRLASVVKFPYIAGIITAKTRFGDAVETEFLDLLDSADASLVLTGQGYVNGRRLKDSKWLDGIFNIHKKDWQSQRWNNFCINLPFCKDTFELIKKLPQETFDYYWKNVNGYYIQKDDAGYINWVIQQLLKYERPYAAIDAAMVALHSPAKEAGIESDLIATALEQAVAAPESDTPRGDISFEIGEAIKYLQAKADIDIKRLVSIEWMYVPLFSRRGVTPTSLINEILSDPTFFVYLLRLMYKADPVIENEFEEFSEEKKTKMAINAHNLLELVNKIPGQQTTENLDEKTLKDWVEKAREECRKYNRADIGDHQIGKLLSFCPVGIDGIWPHEVVREILEEDESQEISIGLEIGKYNQRGITSRAVGSGGNKEREIAAEYENNANKISASWPRTARVLLGMAEKYKREAKGWDERSELGD